MHLLDTHSSYKINDKAFIVNDPNVEWMSKCGIPEHSLIDWCNDTFMKGGNFVDIGAHIGTWSWIIGERASHTYSFECNPDIYNILCANMGIKQLSTKSTQYNHGLFSSSDKPMTYYMRSADGGGNGFLQLENDQPGIKTMEIVVKRLDDFNIKGVDFIKIDTEGLELDVLQGAIKTLEDNNYPPFVFESWEPTTVQRKKLRSDICDYLSSLGYKVQPINCYPEMLLATHS